MKIKVYKNLLLIMMIYVLFQGCGAAFGVFMPLYFKLIKLNQSSIGLLLGIGSLITLISQPLWGIISDRAKTKNLILKIVVAGSGLSYIFFPLSNHFIYLVIIIIVFSIFERTIEPLCDAITLEYIETTKWNFGHIRLVGSIGFALSAVLTGFIVSINIFYLFILLFILTLILFIIVFSLPKIKGHQWQGQKVNIKEILKNKNLMVCLLFSFCIQVTVGFYTAFFPIHFIQLGGNNVLLGWAIMIATISEIVFLIFVDKILKKYEIQNILMFSGAVVGLRWLLMYLISNPYIIMICQLMHGFTYMAFAFSMSVMINDEIPKELRGSGQTLNMLINMSIAPMISSIIGGMISEFVGIREVFLYDSILVILLLIIFVFIFPIYGISNTGNCEKREPEKTYSKR